MAPYDSALPCYSALRASSRRASEPACGVQGSFETAACVAGAGTFDAASLEPILDVIKNAPPDVRASIYVFYCEAISNVIHHAYRDTATAPKLWWTAALQIDRANRRYVFTVADEGGGLPRASACSGRDEGLADRCWPALLDAHRPTRPEARGQGLASFARLARAFQGARLTVESDRTRCTYTEDAGAEVSTSADARKGVKIALDLAPETLGGAHDR